MRESLEADGVSFKTGVAYDRVDHAPRTEGAPFPTMAVRVSRDDGTEESIDCDVLLVATGRKPRGPTRLSSTRGRQRDASDAPRRNVDGIGLDAAGVDFNTRDGVLVDDSLRTTNPNVFAVGDVCTRYQFTRDAASQRPPRDTRHESSRSDASLLDAARLAGTSRGRWPASR